jgi:Flp pilus assembly protein TadG
MRILRQQAKRFRRDERGNFGVVLALIIVPLLGVAGLSVDYARVYSAKDRLQSAVDTAILAAAASGEPVDVMQSIVEDFVKANFGSEIVDVQTRVNNHTIDVRASYLMATPVLSAAGTPQFDIVVTSEVTSPTPLRPSSSQPAEGAAAGHEIARAMDRFDALTARMPHARREALRSQFRDFLNAASTAAADAAGLEAPRLHLSQ